MRTRNFNINQYRLELAATACIRAATSIALDVHELLQRRRD
jgi:hypothetical protein